MPGPRDPLRPGSGARFFLELEARGDFDATARYRGVIFEPARQTEYRVTMTIEGEASLTPVDAPTRTGAELEDMLLMIARLTARGAHKRRQDAMPPWPERVLRWRGPGR